ncbi:MAG: septation regulator SpoVG [Oscillospiraceae bacterium]|jgi:stage V sporulation protein G|nr:septation regulator SpoVG [Oscillospiraceae bacterium]
MEITDIRIRKILQEGRLKAVVSLTIDGSFAVHDIKLVQGEDRIFVAMPSRRDENGTFRDIIHPINPEARKMLEDRIFAAYDIYLQENPDAEPAFSSRTGVYSEC